jgi:hypothetical protein
MADKHIGDEDTRQSPAEGALAVDEITLDTTDSQVEPPPVLNIDQAILRVKDEMPPVAKSEYNKGQKYPYRGIDGVVKVTSPLHKTYGIYCTSEVLEIQRESRQSKGGGSLNYTFLKMRYTFRAADGSTVATEVVGEGMDPGDKSAPKAMSGALKVALLQMYCIPTGGVDSEQDSYEAPAQAKNAPNVPPRGETPEEPVTRDRVMLVFNTWAEVMGHDLTTDEGKAAAAGFPPWVQEKTGRKFNPRKSGEWRQADLKACEEALP